MSDSGRQIGDCKHGLPKACCTICMAAELAALRTEIAEAASLNREMKSLFDQAADARDALRADVAQMRTAMAQIYEWYDRDGSVGGACDPFEDNRHLLALAPSAQAEEKRP